MDGEDGNGNRNLSDGAGWVPKQRVRITFQNEDKTYRYKWYCSIQEPFKEANKQLTQLLPMWATINLLRTTRDPKNTVKTTINGAPVVQRSRRRRDLTDKDSKGKMMCVKWRLSGKQDQVAGGNLGCTFNLSLSPGRKATAGISCSEHPAVSFFRASLACNGSACIGVSRVPGPGNKPISGEKELPYRQMRPNSQILDEYNMSLVDKRRNNPSGLYTEQEVYDMFTTLFQLTFLNIDRNEHGFLLRYTAVQADGIIQALRAKSMFEVALDSALNANATIISHVTNYLWSASQKPCHPLLSKLADTGRPLNELVATVVGLAVGRVLIMHRIFSLPNAGSAGLHGGGGGSTGGGGGFTVTVNETDRDGYVPRPEWDGESVACGYDLVKLWNRPKGFGTSKDYASQPAGWVWPPSK
ncbi:hypothetical protein C8J56DRAFT_1027816 [Mycena floridula]|nr:hypothetical protein C8J56DRAFT_1027816 [Mycena floridula]